jgi:hypothetical protein
LGRRGDDDGVRPSSFGSRGAKVLKLILVFDGGGSEFLGESATHGIHIHAEDRATGCSGQLHGEKPDESETDDHDGLAELGTG